MILIRYGRETVLGYVETEQQFHDFVVKQKLLQAEDKLAKEAWEFQNPQPNRLDYDKHWEFQNAWYNWYVEYLEVRVPFYSTHLIWSENIQEI